MSPRKAEFRILDILEAISDIESFVDGISEDDFSNDRKTFKAVLKCLEDIGIAANSLPSELTDNYPDIPWRLIKDFRNKIAHEYFGVDTKLVWAVIKNELPNLKIKIEKIKDV